MTDESSGTEVNGLSRTALATAYARAYHQVADKPPILNDPVAGRLAGVTTEDLLAAPEPTEDQPGSGVTYRPRRLFFAARARFAEDRVAVAAATGVRQVVILGAGLDTFAYRNPFPDVRVFEVDQAATQAWKRQRLADSSVDIPDTLTFVPVDLETQSLSAELKAAGFSRDESAIFVWLGVVYYLTEDAVSSTLDYIAGQAPPTEVVFDYLQPADSDNARKQLKDRERRVAAAGEPWFSYFTPTEIAQRLTGVGLIDIDDHSAAQLIDSYLDGPAEYENNTPEALRASRILRARRR